MSATADLEERESQEGREEGAYTLTEMEAVERNLQQWKQERTNVKKDQSIGTSGRKEMGGGRERIEGSRKATQNGKA